MKWCLYGIALAVMVTGLLWAGVSASVLLASALVLLCLALIFLATGAMSRMGRGHRGPSRHA